ncbi:MAG: hypothetical protein HGA45_01610 [Chloroflexales bacterium]|nr:hypothetical protein [Chloroflexales bacterium]
MRPRNTLTSPALARWIGVTLIGTGILGLLLSLASMTFVMIAGATAEGALIRELDTFDKALAATSDGLTVADRALADTHSTLAALSATLNNATITITETQPMIGALQDLTGEGLPETIASTHQALTSAQETAQIIDGVLGSIPFVGSRYSPEVPLNVAIGQVADSLTELPTSLEEVSAGLGKASDNIGTIATNVGEVSAGIAAIAQSVSEAAVVVEQYEVVVGDLRGEVAAVRAAAPGWITMVRLGLTVLLIWLGLAQISLLFQGWELLGRGAKAAEEVGEELS